MKKYSSVVSAQLFMVILSKCAVASSAPQLLTIPNIDTHVPPCTINITEGTTQCTPEGCLIPFSQAEANKQLKLIFNCIPISAPTGFENPPSYAELYGIRSKNAQGHLSVVDDIDAAPSEKMRELNFCLWGNANILCGFARIPTFAQDRTSSQRKAIQKFIRQIEFTDPLIR